LEEDYCGEQVGGYGGVELHKKLRVLTEKINVLFYNMCDYVKDIHDIKSEIEPENGCHYNKEGYFIAASILKDAVLKYVNKD